MAFIVQEPKSVVDIGTVGNASTGDILYEGGKKINTNFDAVYNAFADQRLFSAAAGQGTQKIHATGYYQKLPFSDYSSPVQLGSCHDVDTASTGGGFFIHLPKGKPGEAVYVINSNGSISSTEFLSIVTSGDGSSWATGGTTVKFVSPYCRIECWCVKEELNGDTVWDYAITSMFGQQHVPIEKTITLPVSSGSVKNPIVVPIAGTTEFNTIKLLLTFVASPPGGNIRQSAEVLLMIDSATNQVYSTEYGVVRAGETSEDNVYEIDYQVDPVTTKVTASISTKYSNARLAIKAIDTQLLGERN